jgi:OFA family oxalate/formate antiporter-like MFS transporter
MSKKSKTVDTKHSASSNFGRWGWWIIIYTAILMFLANGCQTDGLNLLVSKFSYVNGWDSNTVLAMSTPAGYVALAVGVPLGWLIMKKGTRKVLVGVLVLGGLTYAAMGNSSNIVVYFIFQCIMCTCANCFSVHAANTLVANWFPKKKGLALGWATMGMNASSALYTIILSGLFSKFTLAVSLDILGAVTVLMGIVTLFCIRDTPEEVGCTPDNEPLSQEQIAANNAEHESYQSPWTFGKLLKDKDTWMCGLCYGCFMLVTVGIMSQLVGRIMQMGFTQTYAIGCVSVCAIIGLVGSYAWGVLDQKMGTKWSTTFFGVWYAAGIAFNVFASLLTNVNHSLALLCMYLSIFIIGVSIGGTANFAPSMTTNIFGRRDFPLAFTVINTIYNVMRCTSYVVLAGVLAVTGSYTAAYVVFIFISLIGSLIAWRIDDTEKSQRPAKKAGAKK